MGRPRDIPNDVQQRMDLAEEDRRLRAVLAGRAQDVAAVRLHKARGMSRKHLIAIYGQDVVDQALVSK